MNTNSDHVFQVLTFVNFLCSYHATVISKTLFFKTLYAWNEGHDWQSPTSLMFRCWFQKYILTSIKQLPTGFISQQWKMVETIG